MTGDTNTSGDSEAPTFEGEPIRYPDGNPKHAHGLAKIPMRLAPASARIEMARAFRDGARKYGPYNWRVTGGIAASVYVDAAQRHLDAWFDGEEVAPDSKVHHLGHVMACCAILIDAAETGGMIDDRPNPGNAGEMQRRYQEEMPPPEVKDPAYLDDPIRRTGMQFSSPPPEVEKPRDELADLAVNKLDAGGYLHLYIPPNRVLARPKADMLYYYSSHPFAFYTDVKNRHLDVYEVEQDLGMFKDSGMPAPVYLGKMAWSPDALSNRKERSNEG